MEEHRQHACVTLGILLLWVVPAPSCDQRHPVDHLPDSPSREDAREGQTVVPPEPEVTRSTLLGQTNVGEPAGSEEVLELWRRGQSRALTDVEARKLSEMCASCLVDGNCDQIPLLTTLSVLSSAAKEFEQQASSNINNGLPIRNGVGIYTGGFGDVYRFMSPLERAHIMAALWQRTLRTGVADDGASIAVRLGLRGFEVGLTPDYLCVAVKCASASIIEDRLLRTAPLALISLDLADSGDEDRSRHHSAESLVIVEFMNWIMNPNVLAFDCDRETFGDAFEQLLLLRGYDLKYADLPNRLQARLAEQEGVLETDWCDYAIRLADLLKSTKEIGIPD